MTPALVSRRLQACSGDSGLSDLLPGPRRSPSPARRGRPPSRPAPRRPVTRQQSPALGPWEGLPWARVLPYSLLASLKSPGGSVAGEGDRPLPVGGHSPLPLFPRRGGAGARFPRPPKRFLAAPVQPQSVAAAAGLLHSLLHPCGLKG